VRKAAREAVPDRAPQISAAFYGCYQTSYGFKVLDIEIRSNYCQACNTQCQLSCGAALNIFKHSEHSRGVLHVNYPLG